MHSGGKPSDPKQPDGEEKPPELQTETPKDKPLPSLPKKLREPAGNLKQRTSWFRKRTE